MKNDLIKILFERKMENLSETEQAYLKGYINGWIDKLKSLKDEDKKQP